jgi:hypothetical protein
MRRARRARPWSLRRWQASGDGVDARTGSPPPHLGRSAALLILFPMRRPLAVALLTVAALLAFTGSASAAPSFVATLKAGTHTPKADRAWPVTVTVRSRSGRSLRATATYQFVYNGQVVATRYPSPKSDPKSKCSKEGTCRRSPYPFTGRFRDPTITWPARSAGIALTFRVVIKVKGMGTKNLDYSVRVRR